MLDQLDTHGTLNDLIEYMVQSGRKYIMETEELAYQLNNETSSQNESQEFRGQWGSTQFENDLTGFQGIERLTNLKSIKVWGDDCPDPALLSATPLDTRIEHLEIQGNPIKDVSFIKKYKKLKKLSLGNWNFGDWNHQDRSLEFLDSENLRNCLEDMYLCGNRLVIESLNHLKGYKKLKKLAIWARLLDDSEGLRTEGLQESLEKLELHCPVSNLKFLEGYKKLKTIILTEVVKITEFFPEESDSDPPEDFVAKKDDGSYLKFESLDDFSPLGRGILPETVENMIINNMKGLKNLDFIMEYRSINYLELSGNIDLVDISAISSPIFSSNIRNLVIYGFAGEKSLNLAPITQCSNLESLKLGYFYIENVAALGEGKLPKTLKELKIRVSEEGLDISFLKGYRKLEKLDLSECNIEWNYDFREIGTIYYSEGGPLGYNGLRQSLKELNLSETNVIDLSFLKGYKKLEKLILNRCKNAEIFPSARTKTIQKTLKEFVLTGSEYVTDLSFLSTCRKLTYLELSFCDNIDHRFLLSQYLWETLENLNLQGTKMTDISILQNFQKISDLDLSMNPIKDISEILDYKFVENGSLNNISLPDTIEWTRVKDGKFVNQDVVKEMKKRGIQVSLPNTFPYEVAELETRGKLYIIVSQAGAGKTTLINYMMDELGVKTIPKLTTREYRSKEEAIAQMVKQISVAEFEEKFKKGEIRAARKYYENNYGIDYLDLAAAYGSGDNYMIDMNNVEKALQLRDEFPGFVEVILLLPPAELVLAGLHNRHDELGSKESSILSASEGFSSMQEEMKYLESIRFNMLNTKQRIRDAVQDHCRLMPYKPYADHVVEGNYDRNTRQIRKIVCGER